MEKGIATATALLTLASTVLGIFITYRTFVISDRVGRLEVELKQSQERRAERESLNKLVMEVYGQVEEAVAVPPGEVGVRQQKATQALVRALIAHDPELKAALLEALYQTALPEARQEALESLYVAQEAASAQNIARSSQQPARSDDTSLGTYDFDIFWCESSGPAARQAAEAVSSAITREGGKGRVRTRPLPDSRNRDPGYRHQGFAIRYNAPAERDIAQALSRIATTASGTILGGAPSFTPTPSAQQTPWYLSAFVCPDADLSGIRPARARAAQPTASD